MRQVLAALLAASSLAALAAPADETGVPAWGVLVKLKEPAAGTREQPAQARERLAGAFRGKSQALGSAEPWGPGAHWVRWARPLSGAEAARLIAELKADPAVEWAVPNVRERRLQAAAPSDPFYGSQWWLSASAAGGTPGAPGIAAAWARSTGAGVAVAVLDTGLVRSHPDLSDGRFGAGYDFVTDENGWAGDGDGRDPDFSDPGDAVQVGECGANDPVESEPSSWHGTRIAGMLAASTDNGLGVAGINRQARVVTVRVAGKCGALVSDIVDGMRWAAGLSVAGVPVRNPEPARIVNISFGGPATDCTPYQAAIDELRRIGVLVVAAAGNEDRAVMRPARCPGVLAVGAVTRAGLKTGYSNRGPEVGITTLGGEEGDPGGGLFSTSNFGSGAPGANNYSAAVGTSFSSPIVAGVASLMLSVNPRLSRAQLIDGLQRTSRPHVASAGPVCSTDTPVGECQCTTSTCGAGLLDAPAALEYAAAALPDPSEPRPDSGGGGGGGALDAAGLGLLGLLAAAAAGRRHRRAGRRA